MPTRDNNEAEREARVATILARLERDRKQIVKAPPAPAKAKGRLRKPKRPRKVAS
jgi:hypothetical protein